MARITNVKQIDRRKHSEKPLSEKSISILVTKDISTVSILLLRAEKNLHDYTGLYI